MMKINAYISCFLFAGHDEWDDFGSIKVRPKTFCPSLCPLCHHLLIDWLFNDVLAATHHLNGKWGTDIVSD